MIDYSSLLSMKVQEIKPSGIRKFSELAAEMGNVISLGVGEPDFQTPWAIRQAGIESLKRGRTHYSPNAGFQELKQEIDRYLERRMGLSYTEEETMVTIGGSEAIDMMIRAVVNPGDEVLIPEPCYVSYDPIARLTGAKVVSIPTRFEDDFRLTPESLKAAITPRSKLLIFPYPNNPTGGIMEQGDLEAIAEILRETNILVLSDEIYAELTYGGKKHVSIALIEGMRERTIVVNGFSKTYAMTGWRLGYAVGPAPLIREMTKIHQFAIMCAPTTSQLAAVEALRCCDEEIEAMRDEYDMRGKYLVGELNRIGLECFQPQGAFYVFPSIRCTGLSSEEFCERLLREERVAVIPGSAFGDWGEGHIRISYCYSLQHLKVAVRKIEKFLSKLEREKNENGQG